MRSSLTLRKTRTDLFHLLKIIGRFPASVFPTLSFEIRESQLLLQPLQYPCSCAGPSPTMLAHVDYQGGKGGDRTLRLS